VRVALRSQVEYEVWSGDFNRLPNRYVVAQVAIYQPNAVAAIHAVEMMLGVVER
jgi:hypothetical protein